MPSMTVTATQGGSTANGMNLRVCLLTGALPVAQQTGAKNSSTGASNGNFSFTTTQIGSIVLGAMVRTDSSTNPGSQGLSSLFDFYADATNVKFYGAGRAATTASLVSSGYGFSGVIAGSSAGVEILASAQGIALIAPTAGAVSNLTGTSATTGLLNPVPGALLVAMVSSNGGASTTSMTVSGGGLTWTQIISNASAGFGYAGIWIAQVPVDRPMISAPARMASPMAVPNLVVSQTNDDSSFPGLAAGVAPYLLGWIGVSGSGTSRVLTGIATTDPGDTLLVGVSVNNTTLSVTAVTDSKGNVYTLDGSVTGASPQAYYFRSPGATGGSGGGPTAALAIGDTFTVTTTAVSGQVNIYAVAVPSVGALDAVTTVNTQSNVQNGSSPPVTPTVDNDLVVVGTVGVFAGGSPIVAPPYTQVYAANNVTGGLVSFCYDQLGTGTSGVAQSGNWYLAGGNATQKSIAWTFQPAPTATTWSLAGTASNTSQASAAADTVTLTGAISGTASSPSAASGTLVFPGPVPFLAATGLTTGSVTARTATVSTPTNAGDTLLALVTTQASACTISALTDTKGNVYTLDRSSGTTVPLSYWFRSPGATGGSGGGPTAALTGSDTLTATSAAQTGNVEIMLIDVPGVGAMDQMTAVAGGTTGTPTTSFTPTANNELSVALLANANAGGTPTMTPPFALVTSYHTGVNPYNSAGYNQLGGGTSGVAQSFNSSITASQWYVVVYTFSLATATTWALTGTASSTSSASGTVTQLIPEGGTASNTSQASGTITLTPAVIAGTASNTSSASGTVTLTPAVIAGTASNTSSASGTITRTIVVAATASNTSSASGTITTTSTIAGTASNTSAAQGSLGALVIAGTASNTSSAQGAWQPLVLAGTASNTSTGSGTVTLTPAVVAGTASNVSLASGTITRTIVVAATASNTSLASGTITTTSTIAGTASNTSITSGTITTLSTLAGTASSPSSASGTITQTMVITGTASNTSTGVGVFGAAVIAGTASNTSLASGTITLTPAVVAGTASNTSIASGTIAQILKAAGTATNVSTASGTLTLTAVIAGTAPNTSVASGTFGATTIAGTASNVSTGSGTFRLILAIFGTASNVSIASGVFTQWLAVFGSAPTVSIASGTLFLLTAARAPQHLGGTAIDQNFLGGTATNANADAPKATTGLGGTATGTNLLGGTAVNTNLLGGTAVNANAFKAATGLGGTIVGNVLGGTLDGWTMIQLDITVGQYNDETIALAVTNSGNPLDLTGKVVEAYLKPNAAALDTDTGVYKLSTATGEIVVTNAVGGLANMTIAAADLQLTAAPTFWRLDVLTSGKRNTAMYGAVHITDL